MHAEKVSQITQAKYRLFVCNGVVVNETLLEAQSIRISPAGCNGLGID
jgi:hypothetical protein